MTEQCIQCGLPGNYLMVAVMNLSDVLAHEAKTARPSCVIALDPAGKWAACPICPVCHREPTMKAHYYRREDQALALRMVDFPSLQAPTIR